MMCPNCGSLQTNTAASCTVCGFNFESPKMIAPISSGKTKLNIWEITLICMLLFIILNNFIGIRIINIFELPTRILGHLFGINIFGIVYLLILVSLSSALIYGIYKRKKWAYYSIFGLCILSLVLMPIFGLPWRVGFQEIFSLFIFIIPIFLINLKVYKEYQRGRNG